MVFQDWFNAQDENPLFDDNMAMRRPVEGTVARGNLRLESDIYEGVDENGEFVTEIPFELTRDFLYRGQDRYDVYCQVCHGGIGNGQGVIMTDRKSTRLNSSHVAISYAVFCLKK